MPVFHIHALLQGVHRQHQRLLVSCRGRECWAVSPKYLAPEKDHSYHLRILSAIDTTRDGYISRYEFFTLLALLLPVSAHSSLSCRTRLPFRSSRGECKCILTNRSEVSSKRIAYGKSFLFLFPSTIYIHSRGIYTITLRREIAPRRVHYTSDQGPA